jgi:hypothetical protein
MKMKLEDKLRARLRRAFGVEPDAGLEGRVLAGSRSPRPAPVRRVFRLSPPAVMAAVFMVLALGAGALALASALRPANGPDRIARLAGASPPAAGVASAEPTVAPEPSTAGSWAPTGEPTLAPPRRSIVPTSTPHPPAATQTAATLALNESSGGQSFTVEPGQHVAVVLSGDGRRYQGWTAPTSGDTAVLRQSNIACSAPAGYFCTDFVAVAAGTTQLTATKDPPCRQDTPPCGAPTQGWIVTIRVG